MKINATDRKKLAKEMQGGSPGRSIYEYILERTRDPNWDTIADRKQDEKLIKDVLSQYANGSGQLITKKLSGWFLFAEKLNVRKHRLTIPELVQYVFDIYEDRIIFSDGWLRVYEDGYWKKIPDSEIINQVYKIDGKYANPSRYGSVVRTIKHLKDQGSLTPNHSLICLSNGSLNPLTGKLLKHSSDHFLLNKLLIKWNIKAKCPIWKRTLNQIFQGDPEKKIKIDMIQELFGYLLTADASHHKFWAFIGAGRNGKSLIVKIIEELVGSENCTAIQLHGLNNGHVRIGLLNKLVAIASEVEPGEKIPTSILKSIVSGDMITADEKGRPAISWRPYARVIFCMNPEISKLPRLNDSSNGFTERAILLQFNRTFTEKEQDKGLEQKLFKELNGILVWAVQGLQRLNKRGRFIVPASSSNLLEEFLLESKPVRKFSLEALERCPEGRISTTELFEVFKRYINITRNKIVNSSVFGKEFKTLGYSSVRAKGKSLWQVKIKKQYLPK